MILRKWQAAALFGFALVGVVVVISASRSRVMNYAQTHDWARTAQASANVAQIVALIVAGAWSYRVFIKQRNDHARANLRHSATVVGQTGSHWLVRIEITVTNVGNVLLVSPGAKTAIYQVEPIPTRVNDVLPLRAVRKSKDPCLPWKRVASVKYPLDKYHLALDPGETDVIVCDFALSTEISAVFVHTKLHCPTPDNPQDVWRATSFHRLYRECS